MPITVTFLELTDQAQIKAPERPPTLAYELERVTDPMLSRWFYVQIGERHQWVDRLPWPPERWEEWARTTESWMATVAGERAGYFSLRLDDDPVEVDIFGVLPEYQGSGLGGELLTRALRRGFDLGDRVWLHTCSLDSPAALPNYVARGMRVFRTERRG